MTHKTKQNPYQTHFSYAKPFGSFRRVVETGVPGPVGSSSADSLGFRHDVTVSPGPTLSFVVFSFPSLVRGRG